MGRNRLAVVRVIRAGTSGGVPGGMNRTVCLKHMSPLPFLQPKTVHTFQPSRRRRGRWRADLHLRLSSGNIKLSGGLPDGTVA